MKKWGNIGNKSIPLIFVTSLIVIWEFVTERGYVEKFILPSPSDISVAFLKILPDIKPHVVATVQGALIGFLSAILLALILAILMDNVSLIKKAFYPLLIVSQTVPIIVLAPLFSAWFGFGILPKIVVVTLVCFFPVVVSLLEGLDSVDKDLLNLMKSMGANKLQIFTMVKFPASLVSFYSGLKVAATYSIMGAVIGEWQGGKLGLGLYMLRAKKSFALDKVFSVVIIIVILSIIIFKFVSYSQVFLMPWNKEE